MKMLINVARQVQRFVDCVPEYVYVLLFFYVLVRLRWVC